MPELLQSIVLCGLKACLEGPGIAVNRQCYSMCLAAAMVGIGSTSKYFRNIVKQAFVTPDQGYSGPILHGSAKSLLETTTLSTSGNRTPQEALYHIGAPLAVLESSIRDDTSRPPAVTGSMLLPTTIRDRDYAAAAMLLTLPGMDPNQLMDDKGNTRLTAALSSRDCELASLLIMQPGIDVRRVNADGQTPIALAMTLARIAVERRSPETYNHYLQMRGSLVLELLNTYHGQGHNYSDVVQDLAQYDGDNNVAWVLCERGMIQHCHFFKDPLRPLQAEHLNRPFEEWSRLMPCIHIAAYAGHIDTVTFLLSLRNQGLDIHTLVRHWLCMSQSFLEINHLFSLSPSIVLPFCTYHM